MPRSQTLTVGPFQAELPVSYPWRVAIDPTLHAIYDKLVETAQLCGRYEGRGDEVRAEKLRRKGKRLLSELQVACLATGGATWNEFAEIDNDLGAVRQLACLEADQR